MLGENQRRIRGNDAVKSRIDSVENRMSSLEIRHEIVREQHGQS